MNEGELLQAIEIIYSALPSLAAAAVIFLCGTLLNTIRKWRNEHEDIKEFKTSIEAFIDSLMAQHEALMESQRNQIKNTIVHSHEEGKKRGYITPWELDCLDRLADSYFKLGGNSYIKTTMEKINNLPIEDDRVVCKKKRVRRSK